MAISKLHVICGNCGSTDFSMKGGESTCIACSDCSTLHYLEDYAKIEELQSFSKIPQEVIKQVAELAFVRKESITSDMKIRYMPYVKEHLEDADEYFEALFEGYFAGDNKAFYRVQLRPSSDVAMWYSYKEEKNVVMHVSNQRQIQKLLSKYI